MISCWFFFLIQGVIFFFFFNDTATTEIYTLSLHDALPIHCSARLQISTQQSAALLASSAVLSGRPNRIRSEEHTSELQSRLHLVCRLLLEKKKSWRSTRAGYNDLGCGSSGSN